MPLTSWLVLSCAALVLLAGLVAGRLLYVRVTEMRRLRIHPQAVATSKQALDRFQSVQAADNFRNLFEVPVLFYTLCAVLLATNQATPILVVGAWAYVALRYAHSFIHCTYNKVMHRFTAFVASTTLILVLWGIFVAQILPR